MQNRYDALLLPIIFANGLLPDRVTVPGGLATIISLKGYHWLLIIMNMSE